MTKFVFAKRGSRVHLRKGDLADLLMRVLEDTGPDLSYSQLATYTAEQASDRLDTLFVTGATERQVFVGWRGSAASLWNDIARGLAEPALRAATAVLERHIERRGGIYPQGLVNLGVIYAELGEYKRSVRSFEKAIAQGDALVQHDAQFQLGRVLYLSRTDLGRAVELLRTVHGEDTGNPAAALYLGQAIRALVEQDLLQEAEQALSGYVSQGAPYGQADEVSSFLDSRRAARVPGGSSREL